MKKHLRTGERNQHTGRRFPSVNWDNTDSRWISDLKDCLVFSFFILFSQFYLHVSNAFQILEISVSLPWNRASQILGFKKNKSHSIYMLESKKRPHRIGPWKKLLLWLDGLCGMSNFAPNNGRHDISQVVLFGPWGCLQLPVLAKLQLQKETWKLQECWVPEVNTYQPQTTNRTNTWISNFQWTWPTNSTLRFRDSSRPVNREGEHPAIPASRPLGWTPLELEWERPQRSPVRSKFWWGPHWIPTPSQHRLFVRLADVGRECRGNPLRTSSDQRRWRESQRPRRFTRFFKKSRSNELLKRLGPSMC